MIGFPANTRVWIAAGVTDLRRGFTGLSALVQTKLEESPFSGQVFVFRGRRGHLIKVLWYDGDGLCLFAKRLERGAFRMAGGYERHRVADTSAAVDVARRHRLAAAGAHLGAGAVGVTEKILLHRFFAPRRVQHQSFMRYSAHVSGDASRPGPATAEALKELILTQDTQLIATHEQALSRENEIAHLKLLIARLERMQFGRKSEKIQTDRATGVAAGRVAIESHRGVQFF